MAKSPPGVRAEGAEVDLVAHLLEEMASPPLIARLKQDRARIAKAKAEAAAAAVREADERFVQVIDAFTAAVSHAIINANNAKISRLNVGLDVPNMFQFKGIDICHKRLLEELKKWSSKNGISIDLQEDEDVEDDLECWFVDLGLNLRRSHHVTRQREVTGPVHRAGRMLEKTDSERYGRRVKGTWRMFWITFSWEAE